MKVKVSCAKAVPEVQGDENLKFRDTLPVSSFSLHSLYLPSSLSCYLLSADERAFCLPRPLNLGGS